MPVGLPRLRMFVASLQLLVSCLLSRSIVEWVMVLAYLLQMSPAPGLNHAFYFYFLGFRCMLSSYKLLRLHQYRCLSFRPCSSCISVPQCCQLSCRLCQLMSALPALLQAVSARARTVRSYAGCASARKRCLFLCKPELGQRAPVWSVFFLKPVPACWR